MGSATPASGPRRPRTGGLAGHGARPPPRPAPKFLYNRGLLVPAGAAVEARVHGRSRDGQAARDRPQRGEHGAGTRDRRTTADRRPASAGPGVGAVLPLPGGRRRAGRGRPRVPGLQPGECFLRPHRVRRAQRPGGDGGGGRQTGRRRGGGPPGGPPAVRRLPPGARRVRARPADRADRAGAFPATPWSRCATCCRTPFPSIPADRSRGEERHLAPHAVVVVDAVPAVAELQGDLAHASQGNASNAPRIGATG